jgi:hypothetical protein
MFEPNELFNRFTNEILPLPILNVFKDPEKKDQIIKLLKKGKLTKKRTERIVDIVMEAKETMQMQKEMQFRIREGIRIYSTLPNVEKTLRLLLESLAEDLQ